MCVDPVLSACVMLRVSVCTLHERELENTSKRATDRLMKGLTGNEVIVLSSTEECELGVCTSCRSVTKWLGNYYGLYPYFKVKYRPVYSGKYETYFILMFIL